MRKRPLAAQTDDDSFTADGWYKTISYSSLHVKVRQLSNLLVIKLAVGQADKQLCRTACA